MHGLAELETPCLRSRECSQDRRPDQDRREPQRQSHHVFSRPGQISNFMASWPKAKLKMLYHTRRRLCRSRTFALYCVSILSFVVLWCFFTILILVAQDSFLRESEDELKSKVDEDSYMGRGVQVVVGHYNGNLPKEKAANLTKAQINANNYNPLEGNGEDGRGVRLSQSDDRVAEDLWSINQFNIIASDRISVSRSLPDIRKKGCRDKIYPDPSELPTTSVIIVYHNEAYSTLLRTVHSVVDRSPKPVLKEVILVDDFSDREFLGHALDAAAANITVPVKIIRAQKRVGLIRARLMGAQEASGEVLTFLDSHCECTHGWLEPLLTRIKEDRKTVVCPVIDVINDKTFAYQKGIELFRGGFNWNLQFRWYSVPPKVVKGRSKDGTQPIASPTMAGGLFSIDKKYFEELGTYDPGMDIWGGENLEISFRIWQCGGRVEILPCSHVGHVFRKASPHTFPGKSSGSVLNSNLVRVAEVWMDEWRYLFYKTAPQAMQLKQHIDVSDRIELRKRLHCQDFKWYLDNVWPEHFLPVPGNVFGRVEHLGEESADWPCLHWTQVATGGKRVSMHKCATDLPQTSSAQPPPPPTTNATLTKANRFDRTELWIFTKDGQLKGDEHMCLSATQVGHQWIVQVKECGEYSMEFWDYNSYRKTFKHRESGMCLDRPIENVKNKEDVKTPSLRRCSRGTKSQQWQIREVDWLSDMPNTV